MSSKFVALAAVALIGVGSVASARADVLFDNTGQAPAASDPVLDYSSNSNGAGPIAASFSTGAQGLVLSGVSVVLQVQGSGTGTINVDLVDGGNAAPNGVSSSIGTIDASLLTGGYDKVSVALTSTANLAANRRYWIELSSSDLSNLDLVGWAYDLNNNGTGVAGEYSWSNYSGSAATYSNDNAGYSYMMQVVGVPEPDSFGLLMVGAVVLFGIRRWRHFPS